MGGSGQWSQRSPYTNQRWRCLLWKAVLSSVLVMYVRHDDAAGCEEITGFVSLLVHVGDERVKEEALEAEET